MHDGNAEADATANTSITHASYSSLPTRSLSGEICASLEAVLGSRDISSMTFPLLLFRLLLISKFSRAAPFAGKGSFN